MNCLLDGEAYDRPTAFRFPSEVQLKSFKVILRNKGIAFGETSVDGEPVIYLENKSHAEVVSEMYSEFMANEDRGHTGKLQTE